MFFLFTKTSVLQLRTGMPSGLSLSCLNPEKTEFLYSMQSQWEVNVCQIKLNSATFATFFFTKVGAFWVPISTPGGSPVHKNSVLIKCSRAESIYLWKGTRGSLPCWERRQSARSVSGRAPVCGGCFSAVPPGPGSNPAQDAPAPSAVWTPEALASTKLEMNNEKLRHSGVTIFSSAIRRFQTKNEIRK